MKKICDIKEKITQLKWITDRCSVSKLEISDTIGF